MKHGTVIRIEMAFKMQHIVYMETRQKGFRSTLIVITQFLVKMSSIDYSDVKINGVQFFLPNFFVFLALLKILMQ